MRQAGHIAEERDAIRFVDYALTLGIETRAEETTAGWAIWVFDEDRLAQARQELSEFIRNSSDPRYSSASANAEAVRKETARKHKEARRNLIEMRDVWSSYSVRRRPLTFALIAGSILVSLLTNFGHDNEDLLRRLMLADYTQPWVDQSTGRVQLHEIMSGEVWRLVTPNFVHFDFLHLFFNMYWLYLLGGMVETRLGFWRMAAMLLILAPMPVLGEYLATGHIMVGGMSGIVYGLFGYAWVRGRLDPTSGLYLSSQTAFWMMLWFFLCMTGQVGNIANWAHGTGLVLGAAMAYVPNRTKAAIERRNQVFSAKLTLAEKTELEDADASSWAQAALQ